MSSAISILSPVTGSIPPRAATDWALDKFGLNRSELYTAEFRNHPAFMRGEEVKKRPGCSHESVTIL